MRKKLKIDTLEKAERVLNSLILRSRRHVIGIDPAMAFYSFSGVVPVGGILLRYMSPCNRTLKSLNLYAPAIGKAKGRLRVEVFSLEGGGTYTDVEVKGIKTQASLAMPVKEWDRVVVDLDIETTEVELAMLFCPDMGEGFRRRILLDTLIGELDEGE